MVKYDAQSKSVWFLEVNVSLYYTRSALIGILKLMPFSIYFHFIVSMKK